MTKVYEVFVVYGEDRQSLRAYAFGTRKEAQAFQKGVDEAQGWLTATCFLGHDNALDFQKYGEI